MSAYDTRFLSSAILDLERHIRSTLPPPSILAMYEQSARSAVEQLRAQVPDFDELNRHALAGGEYAQELDRLTRELQPTEYARELAETIAGYSEFAEASLARASATGAADTFVRNETSLALQDQLAHTFSRLGNVYFETPGQVLRRAVEASNFLPEIDALRSEFARSLEFGQAIGDEFQRSRQWSRSELDRIASLVGGVAQSLQGIDLVPAGLSAADWLSEVDTSDVEEFLLSRGILAAEDEEGEESTITERLDTLEDEVQSLGELVLRDRNPLHVRALLVLLSFLLSILASLAANYAYDYLKAADRKRALRAARIEVEAKAEGLAQSGAPEELLLRYRLVTASSLHVRSKASRRSQSRGTLVLGDVVIVLDSAKGRDWSLVRWTSPDGEVVIQGWVFTRYLQKIRLPREISRGN